MDRSLELAKLLGLCLLFLSLLWGAGQPLPKFNTTAISGDWRLPKGNSAELLVASPLGDDLSPEELGDPSSDNQSSGDVAIEQKEPTPAADTPRS